MEIGFGKGGLVGRLAHPSPTTHRKELMKTEALKEFEGRWVSLVVRGLPKNAGGQLVSVGEDCVHLKGISDNIDDLIISSSDIISVLVKKNSGERKDEVRQRTGNS